MHWIFQNGNSEMRNNGIKIELGHRQICKLAIANRQINSLLKYDAALYHNHVLEEYYFSQINLYVFSKIW